MKYVSLQEWDTASTEQRSKWLEDKEVTLSQEDAETLWDRLHPSQTEKEDAAILDREESLEASILYDEATRNGLPRKGRRAK